MTTLALPRSGSRARTSPVAPERGAATVYAVVLVAVLTVTVLAITVLAGVFVVRRQMESAADLAALAGAEALQQGRDPCVVAAQVAERNRASVTECAQSDRDVLIRVAHHGEGLVGRFAIPAHARAGPAG